MTLFVLFSTTRLLLLFLFSSVHSARGADGLENYAYLTYFNDEECTEVALAKPVIAGVKFSIPILTEVALSKSCAENVACAIDANSPECALVGGSTDMNKASLFIQVRDDGATVDECDSSNENTGEELCNLFAPTDCVASSILPGCYARYVSAAVLSKVDLNCVRGAKEDKIKTMEEETKDMEEAEESALVDEGTSSSSAGVGGRRLQLVSNVFSAVIKVFSGF